VSELKPKPISLAMMALLVMAAALAPPRSVAAADVRLYALDCGHASFEILETHSAGA